MEPEIRDDTRKRAGRNALREIIQKRVLNQYRTYTRQYACGKHNFNVVPWKIAQGRDGGSMHLEFDHALAIKRKSDVNACPQRYKKLRNQA